MAIIFIICLKHHNVYELDSGHVKQNMNVTNNLVTNRTGMKSRPVKVMRSY